MDFPTIISFLTASLLAVAAPTDPIDVSPMTEPIPISPTTPTTLNLIGILDKAGEYKTLIHLLSTTHTANLIERELNYSDNGLTILAPTDHAFQSLKPGFLNHLTRQQKITLVLYHVLPTFYSLSSLKTVSNPVITRATGYDGGAYKLNFLAGKQVNVLTGIVETPVKRFYSRFPLEIFRVDKVLLPLELFGSNVVFG